jgi:hypothetical protein
MLVYLYLLFLLIVITKHIILAFHLIIHKINNILIIIMMMFNCK